MAKLQTHFQPQSCKLVVILLAVGLVLRLYAVFLVIDEFYSSFYKIFSYKYFAKKIKREQLVKLESKVCRGDFHIYFR
jgi:hypothetical protein